jgi:hypothetical protein
MTVYRDTPPPLLLNFPHLFLQSDPHRLTSPNSPMFAKTFVYFFNIYILAATFLRTFSNSRNRTDNNTTNRNILKLSLQLLFQHQLLTAPTTISTTEIKNCFCSNIFFIEILLAWTTIPTAATTTVSQATVFNYYLIKYFLDVAQTSYRHFNIRYDILD